jgi:hypothetical protein
VPSQADDHWSKLTDDELRRVVWTTDAPLSLPNVKPFIPANLPEFIIELEYQLDRATDDPVLCAHCPKHQHHWHGFVLLAADGSRYLLGSHCGPKAYSSDYLVANSARNRAKKRAETLLAWDALRARLPDILHELAALPRDPNFTVVRRLRAAWHQQAPGVRGALERLNRNHLTGKAELRVSRTVRDREAEAVRDVAFMGEALRIADLPNKEHRAAHDALKRRLGTGPIWRTDEGDFGTLDGEDWLLGDASPFKVLEDAAKRLRGYALLGTKTADKTTPQIGRFVRETRKDLEGAAAQLARIAAAGRFFARDHLYRLAEWADLVFSEGSRRRIIYQHPTLTVFEPDREAVSVGIPQDWQPPGELLLELLRGR